MCILWQRSQTFSLLGKGVLKMSKHYDFLKDCGAFIVISQNGDFPAGRPFAAVMEDDEYLYLSTHTGNQAHKQIRKNGNIQILALKQNTRKWLRITGYATECSDSNMKLKMFKTCPELKKHFSSENAKNFILFKVKIIQTEFKGD